MQKMYVFFQHDENSKKSKKDMLFFFSICHVTCIPWINFHKGSIHTVIRWYANFCQKVKRYQNHMQRKGIKIICRGMPEVFNVTVLLSVLGNWEILKFDRICMQGFFFITGSLRVLHRHYMYIVYWHRLFIKRILFYVPKRCWWESYTAKF